MNQLQNFFYGDFEVRSVLIDGEPWFVAKDVCDVLEVANPTQAISRLDDDERAMFNIGRQGDANIVNEPGLYSLILGSRKPESRQFKRWITHEVIPTIRKHGAYMTPETLEKAVLNPDFIIKLGEQLKKEQDARIAAESKIELDKPKVIFAEAVSVSDDSILIGQLATFLKQNGVNIGQNRLFQWLRDEGYLCKSGDRKNLPTQRAMELKLFEVKEFTVNGNSGSRIRSTPKVTGRGQVYFLNKFLKPSA
ncbi:phage antirepressor [Paenibacillus sp. HN-1]|uniref:phage antirepressor KilAC domain-containing protein n=1 Tax=Paenibacillus TaxID=44249 RepID=UPI001CA7DBD0|nr:MULTISPECIES: phage antirepressor [Paenibacillus]MBY9081243.1 phage antirepressor [Paenibacillus sp. CGMCC 1.18879]MBY9087280.1 phage antirepressor [Paenibacillus sinensis]